MMWRELGAGIDSARTVAPMKQNSPMIREIIIFQSMFTSGTRSK